MKILLTIIVTLTGLALAASAADQPYLHAPAIDAYATHDPNGLTILPTGRYLKPVGRHVPVGHDPYGLAISRDGKTLFVASDGVGQIITNWRTAKPVVTAVNPPLEGKKKKRPVNGGGADFSPDGRTLYWSSGNTGAVYVFDVASPQKLSAISLNCELRGRRFDDSYAADVKVSGDGKHLYCADVTNFRVAVIDAQRRQVVGSAPVGRYPYALAVVGDKVYAANIGLFEYRSVPPPKGGNFDWRGLTFPPFGYPSPEARDGVEFEGRKIPGLGEAECAGIVLCLGRRRFPSGIAQGHQPLEDGVVGRRAVGQRQDGRAAAPRISWPSGDDRSSSPTATTTSIERIDLRGMQIVAQQRLVPFAAGGRSARRQPVAAWRFPPTDDRLYVAELGINAIAVLDAQTLCRARPHSDRVVSVPCCALSPDGKQLACICFRGFGNGPNAGAEVPEERIPGHARRALASSMSPRRRATGRVTADVLAYNGMVDRRGGPRRE